MKRLFLKNHSKLKQLADRLHSSKEAPLTKEEIEHISAHFHENGIMGEESPYVWAAAEISEYAGDLPLIAESALTAHRKYSDSSHLLHPLRYLLKISNPEKRDRLIKIYSNAENYQLKTIVAEFLVQNGEIERGLRLMIDIVPSLNTDHSTSDSIALWINGLGTPEFKSQLILEACEAEKQGNQTARDIFIWAANLIPRSQPIEALAKLVREGRMA